MAIIEVPAQALRNFIIDASITLWHYMTYDFYPPIKEEVIKSYVKKFTEYWSGKLSFKELCDTCPLPINEFIDRFSFFFLDCDKG